MGRPEGPVFTESEKHPRPLTQVKLLICGTYSFRVFQKKLSFCFVRDPNPQCSCLYYQASHRFFLSWISNGSRTFFLNRSKQMFRIRTLIRQDDEDLCVPPQCAKAQYIGSPDKNRFLFDLLIFLLRLRSFHTPTLFCCVISKYASSFSSVRDFNPKCVQPYLHAVFNLCVFLYLLSFLIHPLMLHNDSILIVFPVGWLCHPAPIQKLPKRLLMHYVWIVLK